LDIQNNAILTLIYFNLLLHHFTFITIFIVTVLPTSFIFIIPLKRLKIICWPAVHQSTAHVGQTQITSHGDPRIEVTSIPTPNGTCS
jgi:hypothetical protein